MANEVQLMQVIVNLLNNSYDAIEQFPQKWIRIETAIENKKAKILITDCGQGIPKDIANKIMAPFFTTKQIGKGTGLGLSISKGIVESQNGQLYYNTSSPNTQFIIELQLAPS